MTPAQLDHLAEQADFAAGFYAVTNPAAARRFAETAATARCLSRATRPSTATSPASSRTP
jgi:hypothetical protein